MRFEAFATLLLLCGLFAGCLETKPETTPTPSTQAATHEKDPAVVLSSLNLIEKPDGKRALADLEKFVSAAPRRFDNMHDHNKARDWLQAQYEAAGLVVTRHKFTGPSQTPNGPAVEGQNILATLPGKDPEKILMFGAHYDGAFNGYGAAYDDGSGTLITLDLARAMATYEWNHTLVFASWDQEEAGLVGSKAYVRDLGENRSNIVVFVNFDMTGINWPAKFAGAVDVPMKADFGGEGDAAMVERWTATANHLKYPVGSFTVAAGARSGASDHASFLAMGVPAA